MATLLGKYHTTDISLLEHTDHVVAAGDALFGTADEPTRLGECWLRFFKIEGQWAHFYWNLLAAELLHDWGKANDGMQRVLTGTGEQYIRHEHFSALLIGLPAVTSWLKGNKQIDVPLVLSAVLTHHLKAGAKADGWATTANGNRVSIQDKNGQFAELVNTTAKRLLLGSLDLTKVPEHWVSDRSPNDIREHRTRIQDYTLAPIQKQSPEARRMLTAVRAALIAADSAGSGYARTRQPVGDAVWKQFVERAPLTGQYLKENIIDKRLAEIDAAGKWDDRGDGKEGWNDFQLACDELPDRALLLAPCGSGKTLAAWRWIAAQAAKRPVGRVLFLYPTRATAKEGFRDYVSWAPEADAALMHGNAAFDLNGMFDNGDARGDGSKYEADRRLFSLGYWPKRVFSATVDQFLGFLQYGYGPMCMLPVLADSVIVIDEVHSFDRHMFTALKEFLKNFNVPVLCMTATLPNDRREMLVECGLTLSGEPPEDLKVISDAPRYTLTHVGTREKTFDAVRSALAANKRVLWVANTVKRCHEITAKFAISPDKMETPDGVPVYCYHSRFKLSDRVNRHNDIIGALKVGQPGALGVTTQVCEMSLDLDVDLLVTEECPVTSLIQRMGRCNRERNARPLSESGTVLVYKADSDLPYSTDDLKGREEFMSKTTGRPLSQTDLESTLNGLAETPPWLGDNVIMFLKSGAYAVGPKSDDEDANTFREGNDYNRPCVLSDEVDEYLKKDQKDQPGYVVPVPKKLASCRDDDNEATHRQLPKYLGVASAGHYHKTVGFCDKLITEWEAK